MNKMGDERLWVNIKPTPIEKYNASERKAHIEM